MSARREPEVTLKQDRKAYNLERRGNNAISNQFLARLRNRAITIALPGDESIQGVLVAWDPFALVLRMPDGREILVQKSDGMTVFASTEERETP